MPGDEAEHRAATLAYWTLGQGRASICPALMTLTVTDADFDKAGYYIREFRQARESAGLSIVYVEARYASD